MAFADIHSEPACDLTASPSLRDMSVDRDIDVMGEIGEGCSLLRDACCILQPGKE